jgi:hypothetical protein
VKGGLMNKGFFFGAYWGPRSAEVGELAKSLGALLHEIGLFEHWDGKWFKKGKSKAEALSHLVLNDLHSLEELLANGTRRNDDGEKLPELGYNFSIWNGSEVPAPVLSLSGSLGMTSAALTNCILLTVHGSSIEEVFPDTAKTLPFVDALVKHFDPEWVVLTDNTLLDAIEIDGGKTKPLPGWIMYRTPKLASFGWPSMHDQLSSCSTGEVCLVSRTPEVLRNSASEVFQSLVRWTRHEAP